MSVVTMSQRIEAERKDLKLGEIKELNLDGCTATQIEGLSDEYTSLQRLSVVNAGLETLAGLPSLPALTKLNVAGNPINGGIEVLSKCSNLEVINLSGNKLKSVNDLLPLAELENLCSLELNNCDIAAIENYRKEVFAILPNLKYLDGLDRNGEEEVFASKEREDEDDESEDEEEEEEEEVGISALQGSKDLDDDEEDYVPGEDEDELEDEGDDDEDDSGDEDDDGDDENDEVNEDDIIANLSGADVTGPRRAAKRTAEEGNDNEVSSAKCPAPESNGDCEPAGTNGSDGTI